MNRKKRNSNKFSIADSSFKVIYLTVVLVSLIIAVISIGDFFLGTFLTSEDGPVQIFSVVGYGAAIIAALVLQWKGRVTSGYGAAVILLAMGLRELDLHERFTTMGIMKTRFFLSEIVPLQEKIIAGAVLLGLAMVIGSYIAQNFRSFITSLKAKNRAALLALNGILFIIISKLIDANSSLVICAVEETMEMAIPYFFLCALMVSSNEKKRQGRDTG